MKRPKIYLGALVTLALILSVAMGTLVVAESPPGANTNNVEMWLTGLPTSQMAGQDVDYTMTVTNEQSSTPFLSADAQDITVTFYPAQAGDGTPSATGTVVGTIPSLLADAEPVVFVVTYPMPALDPGVTEAVSRAVLNGTILLGASGQTFSREKFVVITPRSGPVGGTALPIDKVRLVAPWAILLGCAGIATLLVIRKRRQA